MALKSTIYLAINSESIFKYISPLAQQLVYKPVCAAEIIDLVAFPYASSAVVTSAAAKKALLKTQISNNHKVFIGWEFTIEARALLNQTNITLLAKQEFGWSDERWFAASQ